MPGRKPRRRADERIERLAGARGLVVSAVAMTARSSLMTHILGRRDEYLERETVFGVKASLIRELEADMPTPDGRRTDGPWTSARFDIVLASVEGRARQGRPLYKRARRS
jgi:hypothetical protein